MATVLHKRTGWPIFGIGEAVDAAKCSFNHVFVRQPDGLYRDAVGPDQTEADMLNSWKGPSDEPLIVAPWTADRRPFAREEECYRLCDEIDIPRLFPDLQSEPSSV
jgi:hypothetical protein